MYTQLLRGCIVNFREEEWVHEPSRARSAALGTGSEQEMDSPLWVPRAMEKARWLEHLQAKSHIIYIVHVYMHVYVQEASDVSNNVNEFKKQRKYTGNK